VLFAVAFTGSQFAAVGGAGTVCTSPDGVTWTARGTGTSSVLGSVAWSGTQLLAVDGAGAALTSPDGVTWKRQSEFMAAGMFLGGFAWTGRELVMVGDFIMISP
jgi:hypothetical protein